MTLCYTYLQKKNMIYAKIECKIYIHIHTGQISFILLLSHSFHFFFFFFFLNVKIKPARFLRFKKQMSYV